VKFFRKSWLIFLPLGVGLPFAIFFPPELSSVSLTFLGFVVFLGFFVHRYAVVNLEGDLRGDTFLAALTGAVWAIQGMSVTDNLGVFFLFWLGASLGLHRLLSHFRQREGSSIVAWEKFWISRLGDLALLSALVLFRIKDGSWQFSALVADEPAMLLIVAGVLLKSAQVPVHAWLTRTLEAPTPVSALLHAGVINAGAFLLIRLSPLWMSFTSVRVFLIVVGTLSALWGGFTLLVQSDIKRKLAWSTVGQMGFVMIELGLGAPGLALIHLMGHGLYKARSFLWSGSYHPDARGNQSRSSLLGLGLLLWTGIGGAWGWFLAVRDPGHLLISAIVWALLLPLIFSGWEHRGQAFRSLALGTVVLTASLGLSWISQALWGLGEWGPRGGWLWTVGWGAFAVLTVASVLAGFHRSLSRFRWFQAAYAAALHGFGFGRWPDLLAQGVRK
jgi:NAD(P)H-quinone oxidoreductase subunit 5